MATPTNDLCQWIGCHFRGDAELEGRLLCRDHFHQSASNKLHRYQSRLRDANECASERASLIQFVSEVISQTTLLVSRVSGKSTDKEVTETVNVSMKGACIKSSKEWDLGEPLTIARLDTDACASARVTRVDRSEVGMQIWRGNHRR